VHTEIHFIPISDCDEPSCCHGIRLPVNTPLMNYGILYSTSVTVQGSAKQTTYNVYKIKLQSDSQSLDTPSYGYKVSVLWSVLQDYFRSK